MSMPSPHGDKLRALVDNSKLPDVDRDPVNAALERYADWVAALTDVTSDGDDVIGELVELLTDYKNYIDLELIFDSEDNFLYRQKGQLKLDNTILEEFIPWLVVKTMPDVAALDLDLGPANCFSALLFESEAAVSQDGGGMTVRSKDQDFAVARKIFLQASHHADFRSAKQAEAALAYLAAEIKTNLDKTMFQEAAATARDVKLAVPGAQYLLLCEWLDMTPISTAGNAIDQVIILRKAKRLSSSVRSSFATIEGRHGARDSFAEYLQENPFAREAFERLQQQIQFVLGDGCGRDSRPRLVLVRPFDNLSGAEYKAARMLVSSLLEGEPNARGVQVRNAGPGRGRPAATGQPGLTPRPGDVGGGRLVIWVGAGPGREPRRPPAPAPRAVPTRPGARQRGSAHLMIAPPRREGHAARSFSSSSRPASCQ